MLHYIYNVFYRFRAHRVLAVTLFFVLFLSSSFVSYLRAQQYGTLDTFRQNLLDGKVLVADFSLTTSDSPNTTQSGRMWVHKGGYKIVSGPSVIVADSLSRVYDQSKNRLIIDQYYPEDDDFAPYKLLGDELNAYAVTLSNVDEHKQKVSLETDDPFVAFKNLTIVIDHNGIPYSIIAEDQLGIRLNTIINDASLVSLERVDLNLYYPENVEIIDLREED